MMKLQTAFFSKYRLLALSALVLLTTHGSCQVKKEQSETAAYATKVPHRDGIGKVYLGREIAGIMGAAGGAWLERNSRQQEENVALAIENLPLDSHSVVADIGAGTGYYSFRMARRVPNGKVYAVEVQDEFINSLQAQQKELGLTNVEVIRGGSRSPNLPDASVDVAIMVDVYHELEFPQEILQAIHKALKLNGKLLLLEYRAEDRSIPIKELHKMSVAQVTKELKANGFKLFKQENFLPIQHFLLFEKAGKQ